MSKSVEDFIRATHKQFNVKYALTGERLRSLRFKLAMAEINETVRPADESLAQDIILADYKKSSSNLRTASTASMMRNAGTCPRCQHGMTFARLASSTEARYCPSCHVCVPNV